MAANVGPLTAGFAGVPALLYRPEFRQQIIDRYRDDDFLNFMDQMGKWTKKGDTIFYTAYQGPRYQTVDTTGATITGSGTATVTITTLNAANSGILVKGRLVIFPNGLQGRVVSVVFASGVDTVVIKSSAAGNPVLTLVAGGILIPYSNAQEEGSLEPPMERSTLTTFYNLIEIFRKAGGITDVQRGRSNGGLFAVEDGGKDYLYDWGAVDSLMKHRGDIGFGMLMNEISDVNFTATSPTLTGEQGYGVQVTRGLVPTCRDFGFNFTLATPGTWTITDLETLTNLIVGARGADEYLLVGSTAAVSRTSSFLKNLASSGVQSVRIVVDGRTVDLMVEKFMFGGKTYNLASWNTFDNAQVIGTGLTGTAAVAKSLYCIPMGKAAAYERNGSNRGSQDYLSVGYLPVINSGDGDEKQAMVHLGALAARPTDGTANERWVYETMAGLDVVNPYTFGAIRVLA